MRPRRQLPRRGSILIAVMGLMLLATIIVLQYVAISLNELRYKSQREQRDVLRPVAYSALETSLGVLHEFKLIDEGLFSPAQGWGDPIAYAKVPFPDGYTVHVNVTDESGRLPLRSMDKDALMKLFDLFEIGFSEAETLAESLLDWTDEDEDTRLNGAEEDWYDDEGLDLRPPNKPLRDFRELRKIRGFRDVFYDEEGNPNEYYQRFTDSVSLYHTGAPNLNTAPLAVLDYLGDDQGIDPSFVRDFLNGNDRVPGTEDDDFLRSADDAQAEGVAVPSGGSFSVGLVRVEVAVSKGPATFHLSALVSPDGAAQNDTSPSPNRDANGTQQTYPFQILSLVENRRID